MKLDGGVVVLICVIELSHGAQWVADHENITVCYNTDPCPLFDWRYTSDTAVQLIRWQYQAPGNNTITIMAATDDNGEPSFVEDGYKGRLFRDNSSQAAMRFCQMQESERVGTYSVEVVLVGTGLLGTGFVEEIMECALPTTDMPETEGTTPLSGGAIAGIVIAVIILCVVVIIIVICLLKKNTQTKVPRDNQSNEKGDNKPGESIEASDVSKQKNSTDKGQTDRSTPTSVSNVAIKDDRVPNLATDTPRKLPPLNLLPVNRVNPEDNPDGQEHEKKKKKKKKHKKRHHDENEQTVEPEQNGESNLGYNDAEYDDM